MQLNRHRTATRRLLGVALLALLLAQWSALAHAVLHGRSAVAPSAAAASAADHNPLWGHPAHTPVCQLVDHLLAAQAPGGQAPALVGDTPPAAPFLPAPARRLPGAPFWAYDARGPPQA